jgi:hypothetical protein
MLNVVMINVVAPLKTLLAVTMLKNLFFFSLSLMLRLNKLDRWSLMSISSLVR